MKRILFYLLTCLIIFTYGCSKKIIDKNTETISQAKPAAESITIYENELNPKIKNIISDNPENYTNNIRCTNEDINTITDCAKILGIEDPYIPTRGYATDYIIEVRKEKDDFVIIYPHFAVTESSKNIPPKGKSEQEKDIDLNIGHAKWRMFEDNPVQLYLELKNVYITIDSAKFINEKEYIPIANSLVQVKK